MTLDLRTLRRLIALAGAATAVAVTAGLGGSAASAGTASVPFTDPQAHGYIGLCDQNGHNVDSGNVNSRPFVWRAVSSTEAPAQFQGRGQNAALFVFQPRPQTAPAEFSGKSVEGTSYYASSRYPTAQATYQDLSLETMIKDFPPEVDGLYEVRMYFAKANYGTYGASYPVTVIQVQGDRWKVVQGGVVDCAQAKATTQEAELLHIPVVPTKPVKNLTPTVAPASDLVNPSSVKQQTVPATATSPKVDNFGAPKDKGDQVADQPFSQSVAGLKGSGGVSGAFVAVVGVAVIVVVGLAGYVLFRRFGSRRAAAQ